MKATFKDYFAKMKNYEELILQFLDNNDDVDNSFKSLINIFKTQKVSENKNELKLLLHLICEISDNYHRSLNFFNKIDQILKFFENEMKQYFSKMISNKISQITAFSIYLKATNVYFYFYSKKKY